MKTKQEWYSQYQESHRHPTNKLIHHFCVPLIMLSLYGLVDHIPVPSVLTAFNWTYLITLVALTFYYSLDLRTGFKMGLVIVGIYMLISLINIAFGAYSLWFHAALFALSWIGQFIGHKIEGKKPSFFQDIQFLLIGPIWVFKF